MAGGMLAAALAEHSLRIVLVDAAPPPDMPEGGADLRVSALTESSENLLRHTGVWPLMPAARLQPYSSMDVRDGDGTGEVQFFSDAVGADHIGTLVENRVVTAALYQRCGDVPHIIWRNQCRVDSIVRDAEGWQVTLGDGETIAARLLVGADGARSLVRGAAGLTTAGRDTGHVAIVATLNTEYPHQQCARQGFLDSGPFALLPLFGDGHQCSLVWSVWPSLADELMQLSDADFAVRLTRASQHWLGNITLLSERLAFPIQDLHAGDYVTDKLALIGDAAHVIHPLAGQGINLGLLDAAVLAEEIERALLAGRDWSALSVLQRYQRRRRGHNATMVSAMRGFKVLFEQRTPLIRFVRNSGMNLVNRHGLLKAALVRQALGRNDDLPKKAMS